MKQYICSEVIFIVIAFLIILQQKIVNNKIFEIILWILLGVVAMVMTLILGGVQAENHLSDRFTSIAGGFGIFVFCTMLFFLDKLSPP